MTDVPIRVVDDLHAEGNFKVPGVAKWWSSPDGTSRGLHFWCPCGCGSLLGVTVAGEHAWKWDGDREKPTVTPSILHMHKCRWHGYLTAGVFRSIPRRSIAGRPALNWPASG